MTATLGVEVSKMPVRNAGDIERSIDALALASNSGLFVLPGSATVSQRELIVALAARHRLPAVYSQRYFAVSGGLASYGTDDLDLTRRAASYADRILKGAKPADLPVVQASKFELVINHQTARMLGITVPPLLLTIADEVIE